MAGHIVKITIEDTHPPVWRRLILPEAITFYDLHQILQIVFGWEDCHLHDFRTSDDICISLPEAATSGDELNEKKTTVDDFLSNSKWIRYTYDFGDDWRHKIIFEKDELSYGKRYASVLKSKGDNFFEDSWGDEEDSGRKLFSMEAVNSQLEKLTFPKRRASREQAQELQSKADQKKIKETLDLIQQIYKENGLPPKSNYEVIREILNGTLDINELTGAGNEIEVRPSSADTKTDEFVKRWFEFASNMREKRGYRIDVIRSEKNALEILSCEEDRRLQEFCKFSAVNPASARNNVSKRKKAAMVLDAFRQHPESLYYIFFLDEYKWIRQYCFGNVVNAPLPDSIEAVGKLVNLGFAELLFRKEGDTKVAEISVAADLESILPVEKGKKLKRTYNTIEADTQTLLALLTVYGAAEIEEIYRLYASCFAKCTTLQDFLRFVYWHCRYNLDCILSATDERGRNWMIHGAFDPSAMMQQYRKHPEIPYKVFSKEDVRALTCGIAHYLPEWALYLTSLSMKFDLSGEELQVYLADTLVKVLEGCTVDEILARCRKDLRLPDRAGLEDECSLWGTAMELAMETPIPLFRGHSRYEAMEQFGFDIDGIALFPVKKKWKKPGKTTGLTEMSPELQMELYDMYCDENTSFEDYDHFMGKIGGTNYQVRYLQIHNLIMDGEYDRAETETRALMKESRDPAMKDLLAEIAQCREVDDKIFSGEDLEDSFPFEDGNFEPDDMEDDEDLDPELEAIIARMFGKM
ncbi:MAG: plasmid pRiA4b ORF-3 family protein [Lachnospiraceae bacterium]|nr:plasmid pRiA4b ORF-3 family protein [Lachnospiraceae bacterium]